MVPNVAPGERRDINALIVDAVAGKQVPATFFGSTKMNNNFDLVDEVVKEAQGTATIFVKNGEEYVRVATNVKKDDGSRAVGTILDPKGKAIEFIKKDEPFYGEVDILGKPYITGYKPTQKLTLVRNPSWDKSTDFKPAYFDRIEETCCSDATVAAKQTLTGQNLLSGDYAAPPARSVGLLCYFRL